jgi:oligopeptide/dipeptide ABC transporter ATP-binding protein
MKNNLLSVKDLVKYFPVYSAGILRKVIGHVHAVDHVNFSIREGKTMALVGESGCGKTTTAKVILNVEPPTSGDVYFEGGSVYKTFSSKDKKKILYLRRNMGYIYQNPYTSLNPRMTIYEILKEPLYLHKTISEELWEEKIFNLLDVVGLKGGDVKRHPHEFSGGQRQRISIARAIASQPKLILADEPVSSLDVSIRAQILNLLKDLQEKFNLTFMYISHDLSSVRQISHTVAVMYLGEIVELANTDELFDKPLHPYTNALLSAVPIPDPDAKRIRIILPGEVPSPTNPPKGCRFHPRCQYAGDKCKEAKSELVDVGKEHYVACHKF